MLELQVIVGSTRPDRAADKVVDWVMRRLSDFEDLHVELLDLREWALPMFCESLQTVGDPTDPTYSDLVVKRWNEKIAVGDAYLFITPEYNHSLPGALKNAIDTVYESEAFRNKPAGVVAYSEGLIGGARAAEHLAHVAIAAELVPLKNAVLLARVPHAFDDAGNPAHPVHDAMLRVLLEDVAWWGAALQRARLEGELPTKKARVRPPAGIGPSPSRKP